MEETVRCVVDMDVKVSYVDGYFKSADDLKEAVRDAVQDRLRRLTLYEDGGPLSPEYATSVVDIMVH